MSEQPETWKRIESEPVADCRVFKVRRDFCERVSDGVKHDFFVIENPDWVNVIALTRDEQVVAIKQFRHGAEEIVLEIPGGLVDEDEDVAVAAARELVEETGYVPREMIPLGKSRPNPALQNNWQYHFLALDCEKTEDIDFDETENVVTKLIPLTEIERLIETEEMNHSAVVTAFHKLALYSKRKMNK